MVNFMTKSHYFPRIFAVSVFLLFTKSLMADAGGWPRHVKESEGVLWFWGDQKSDADILDDAGESVRKSEGLLRGNARFTWYFGVSPSGGYLEAVDAGPVLARSLMATPSLHVELALHPPREGAAQGLLVWIGDFGDEVTWQLGIREGRLFVQQAGGEPADLGPAPLPEPRHLAVTLTEQRISVQWDGGEPAQHDLNRLPVIPDEWDVVFSFGGAPASEESWTGELEALYVSARGGTAAEHARLWNQKHAVRTSPPVLDILAEVSTPAASPEDDSILEYDSTLMATVWTLKEGEIPGVAEGERFLSWHWYSLDRQVYQAPLPAGAVRRLRLSPAELQPQLEGIQKLSDPLDADDLLLLPELYLLRSVDP